MTKTFSRAELHALVWSRPISHIAREFGISDVALHKVCVKHNVPKPPPGWWTRQATGKTVKIEPLPDPKAEATIRIRTRDAGVEPSAVAAARDEARRKAAEAAAVPISDPIVEATIGALRRAKPAKKELVVRTTKAGLVHCEVCPGSIDRVHLVLSQVAAAASAQGFRLAASSDVAVFVRDAESVRISLLEVVRRSKHIPTPDELAARQAWQRKRIAAIEAGRPPAYRSSRPETPEWDYAPTGQLRLELEQVYIPGAETPRRSFSDGKVQRLETLADEIAVAIATIAAAKTEAAQRHAKAEQARLEAEQQRLERLRAAHIEARRVKGVHQLCSELEELLRLQQLLRHLEAPSDPDATPRVATMRAWIEHRAQSLQVDLSPTHLEERFADQSLFGEKDDRDFRPPWGY